MTTPTAIHSAALPAVPPEAARAYLAVLDGPEAVYLWVAHASGQAGAPLQRWGTLDALWPWLRGMNAAGRSIYVTLGSHLPEPHAGPVEATPVLVRGPQGATVATTYGDLIGRKAPAAAIRTARTIQRIRAVKLDIDDGGDTFLERLQRTPLPPPSILVQTSPGRFQALWELAGNTPATDPAVRVLEKALASLLGGDPAVVDAARVFRVPGLLNPKHPGAPLVTVVSAPAPPPTYHLRDLCERLGVSATPADAPTTPGPAAAPAPTPTTWTPDQAAWRNATWARTVVPGLGLLEFNRGTSTNAMKRAVFLAADYGFTAADLDSPECLGPWLAGATAHPRPDGTTNPDAEDRPGFARRLYESCLKSRAEAPGYRITEEWFRRGLSAGLFPESYPPEGPGQDGAPTEAPPPAPTGARGLPDNTPDGVAVHFCATEAATAQPPVADAHTGEVYLFDAATALYHHTPKDTLERLVVSRYRNALAVDPNAPGRPVVITWRSQRQVEDTLRAVQRTALDATHGPRGGVGFADGTCALVDPESGAVVMRRATPAERLGVGAYHYPFEHVPGAIPATFLRWLQSCFTDEDAQAKVLLLRQWIGAAILGAARRTATAPVLQGPPHTGKSVLLNILKAVMPDLWGLVTPAELGEEYTRARLATSRLLVCPDNVDAHGFRHLKSIISDDPPLSARDPYGRKHQVVPHCGVILASNGRLTINEDPSDGIWRRLAPVEFTRPPVSARERRDIAAEVVAAGEVPLIVSWALEGARDLADAQWTLPTVPAVEEERAAWQRHGNSFLDWLATQTEYRLAPGAAGPPVVFGDLFESYGFDCSRFGVQHKMSLGRAFGGFRYLHKVSPPEDMRRGVCVNWTRTPATAGQAGNVHSALAEALRAQVDPHPPEAPLPADVLRDLAQAWHWDARVRDVWAGLPAPVGATTTHDLARRLGADHAAVLRCLRTDLDKALTLVPLSPRVPGLRWVVRLRTAGEGGIHG